MRTRRGARAAVSTRRTAGQAIAEAARLWLRRGSPWMARAKRELTAFSPAMVELGLRELFAEIAANVEMVERLESPCWSPAFRLSGKGEQAKACTPTAESLAETSCWSPAFRLSGMGVQAVREESLIAKPSVNDTAKPVLGLRSPVSGRSSVCHILSGNLPNPGIISLILGLLAGARNLVKPATGDPMPALFLESLAAVDPALARRVTLTADRQAYRQAGTVVVYGSDETIGEVKRGMRSSVPVPMTTDAGRMKANSRTSCTSQPSFHAFGSRVSIGLIDFTQPKIRNTQCEITSLAALDVSLWDQQGCMSPQCIYVKGDAARFAAALAAELERFDRRWPRAALGFNDAAAIARARNEWSFRGRVWASRGSTHWTVVLDEQTSWALSPLNRFVFIRPIELLPAQFQNPKCELLTVKCKISTVGFAGFSLADVMLMAHADRYCSLGQMQRPSLLLTHGSRPRVGELRHES